MAQRPLRLPRQALDQRAEDAGLDQIQFVGMRRPPGFEVRTPRKRQVRQERAAERLGSGLQLVNIPLRDGAVGQAGGNVEIRRDEIAVQGYRAPVCLNGRDA